MAPLERLSALSYILPSAFLACAKVNYVGTVTCYLLMHTVGPLGVGAGEPGPLRDDGTGMALAASVAPEEGGQLGPPFDRSFWTSYSSHF
jgi:hypothetical protein